MSQLQVQGLCKAWGESRAVSELNFSIEPGEFVALLGPSGCGKSTTLKMIAGLEEPTSGVISLNDRDITHLAPGKRGLAMVFQSYALFPHLSVAENILFGLKARRVAADECQRRLKQVAELVDLGAHLNKKPGQLSGGQCQRVALARAIVAEAPLCLMDEPLSNLDAKLRNEMRAELRALQQRLGMTVLYVTHDQVEAMSMADRILLLNKGELAQEGTPEALYNRPENTFVARFIGNPPMNLIEQGVTLLGVRPEHVYTAEQGMSARVAGCDYHGADTIIDAQLPEFGNQIVKLRKPGHQVLPIGMELKLGWQPEHEHRFDKASGQRLDSSLASPSTKPSSSSLNNPSKTESSHVG
ncbi:ABC transporter ATP-binding protein [Marinobacterium mangrovicola]|uniref:sn-glycerol 3-phosphate transport system ATP-binding protein n=1 Tax=Marinobacterium mangrovicola TaxID=1476959 RepID=A0A4R1G7U1_9GAMM|nr:ABC transporter ATP-binding protein [Marinobacterium mangrovicola]TCK02610.1 sn-glycerol 3-phosphate transport system ATP-binding protein [Marinobacterium mangrovicola]